MGFICVAELFSFLFCVFCFVCLRFVSYFKRISFLSKHLFFRIGVDEYMGFICVAHLSSFLCCVVFLCFVLCLSSSYVLCSMFPMSLDCPFFIAPSVFSDVYFIWYMFDLILTSSYANKVSHVMYVLDVLVPCRSNKLFYYVGDSIITKKRVDIPLTDLIRTRFCTACSKPGPVFTCL